MIGRSRSRRQWGGEMKFWPAPTADKPSKASSAREAETSQIHLATPSALFFWFFSFGSKEKNNENFYTFLRSIVQANGLKFPLRAAVGTKRKNKKGLEAQRK
jgi:hypothetical protein